MALRSPDHIRMEEWSQRDAQEVFGALLPPAASPAGAFDGRIVGRTSLVRGAKLAGIPTPFRGWCGKEFRAGSVVQNFAMRGGRRVPTVVGAVSQGPSMLDGKPALIVRYDDAAWPTRWMRGEVRQLGDGSQLLGMLFMHLAGRPVLGPFPFLLTATK